MRSRFISPAAAGEHTPAGSVDSIDLSIRLFSDSWKLMCAAGAGYATSSDEGLECVFSGVPVPFCSDRGTDRRALRLRKGRAT